MIEQSTVRFSSHSVLHMLMAQAEHCPFVSLSPVYAALPMHFTLTKAIAPSVESLPQIMHRIRNAISADSAARHSVTGARRVRRKRNGYL